MFIKNKDYEKFILKTELEIGDYFGLEKQEVKITLREPDTLSTLNLRDYLSGDQAKLLEIIKELLVDVLVDHNLYEDENTKMKKEDVIDLIFSKSKLTTYVVGEYISSIFPVSATEDKSE